jgi:hypothetical protein
MRAKRPASLNIGLDLDPESPGLVVAGRKRCGAIDPRQIWRYSSTCGFGDASGSIVNNSGAIRLQACPGGRSEGSIDSRPAIAWRGEAADGIDFLLKYPFTGCGAGVLRSTLSDEHALRAPDVRLRNDRRRPSPLPFYWNLNRDLQG